MTSPIKLTNVTGKYDCEGKLLTLAEAIRNIPEYKGLSKAEIVWRLEPK